MEQSSSGVYVGIDNGSTGSIGYMAGTYTSLLPMSKLCRRYTGNKKGTGLELDPLEFYRYISNIQKEHGKIRMLAIEKPFTNPGQVMTMVAARGMFSAIQAILEILAVPYIVVGAQEWQKKFLNGEVTATANKGEKETKLRSRILGSQRWPELADPIKHQKDADALWLALHAKQQVT